MSFKNRKEAGKQLAATLLPLKNKKPFIILALPRGGVPVAKEVAQVLNAPLDLWLVRKLGFPSNEELAFGAISYGDVIYFNEEVLQIYPLTQEEIDEVLAKEQKELARRNHLYRDNRPVPDIKNKRVILVDDGIATGATIKAAIKAIKQIGCQQLIVATPVGSPDTLDELREEVDAVYSLLEPLLFMGVGQFYEDFQQVSDDEVKSLLETSGKGSSKDEG